MPTHLPAKTIMCHHTGFEKSCRSIVDEDKCCKWVKVSGQLPDGTPVDEFGCSDTYMFAALHEVVRQSIHAAASADKSATETYRFHRTMAQVNNVPVPEPLSGRFVAMEHVQEQVQRAAEDIVRKAIAAGSLVPAEQLEAAQARPQLNHQANGHGAHEQQE